MQIFVYTGSKLITTSNSFYKSQLYVIESLQEKVSPDEGEVNICQLNISEYKMLVLLCSSSTLRVKEPVL